MSFAPAEAFLAFEQVIKKRVSSGTEGGGRGFSTYDLSSKEEKILPGIIHIYIL